MSIVTDINVPHHRQQYPSAEMRVSNGRKTHFLHKRRIFIGKRSISIHALCKPLLFRKKGTRMGVSKNKVLLSFYHRAEATPYLYAPTKKEPVPLKYFLTVSSRYAVFPPFPVTQPAYPSGKPKTSPERF